MNKKFTEEDVKAIFDSLENPKYLWRTIDGISKEAKADPNVVLKIIEAFQDEIIESSSLSEEGERLYTTRRHYRHKASPVRRLWRALKNRPE